MRENWGAPFVIVFIVLLVTSAVYLSSGKSSSANNVAVYAFYALVIGVCLQIASYVKYGDGPKQTPTGVIPPSSPPTRTWLTRKRTLALVIVLLIILAGTLGGLYSSHLTTGRVTTSSTTHKNNATFAVGLNFIKELPQANDSVEILVGINETGGLQPINYTASWSDGVNQTNSVGVFVRSFLSGQNIPGSLKVQVNSSDGKYASIVVTIPSMNRTATVSQ